ncbi:serine protease [Pilimelia anulata]|uniref:Serine protease n=1 Tax=Pilimelia anulata TaxID=53371 RepID=A0A8J3B343_9ACTN|nr:trypsin-like serine protease [Pilimelia anulata]GGJ89556.1 serine protease [Pilimelia anulata]
MPRRSLLLAALLAGALLPAPAAAAPAAAPAADRIFGGRDAESGPWAAALYWADADKLMCSGTVVADRWVMSASHCVPGVVKPGALPVTVRVGQVEAAKGEAIVVERIVQPPANPSWDIALFKLSRPITDPVPVRLGDAEPPVGAVNEIFGWGRSCAPSANCGPSPVLRTATVRVTTPGVTDYRQGPAISSTKDSGYARPGDSGGPQFHDGKQVGVASTAADGMQWYSSVPRRLAWIREHIGR